MVFEHFALNVGNVLQMVQWYVANLGLKVVSWQKEPTFTTFLADASNRVVLELYHSNDAVITNLRRRIR